MFKDERFPAFKEGEDPALTRKRIDAYAYTRLLQQSSLTEDDFDWEASGDYYSENLDSVILRAWA